MTSPKVATTFVASEVKLYLAPAPPSSSPPLSRGPIASSSLGAAGPVLGPPPVHLKARSRSTNEHRVWAGSGHRSIAPPNSSRSTHRLCRVPADEPSLVPL